MTHFGAFVVRRLGLLILGLVLISIVTFAVTRAAGNPLFASVGQLVTEEMIEQRAEQLGLNDPLIKQYFDYMSALLTGDLGESRRTFTPVTSEIGVRLPATIELVLFAMAISMMWAVPLGIQAGRKPSGWASRVGEAVSQFGVSVPSFWLGLLLIFLFFFLLPIFPAPLGRLGRLAPPPHTTGLYTVDALLAGDWSTLWAALRHLVLPAVTLSVTSAPPIFRASKSAVAEAMASPFVAASRSYGVSERTIVKRSVARNAFPPILNLTAMTFGYLVGGAVLVEVVFSWPGIGLYAVKSMDFADYDAVMAVVLISAAIYMVLYFIVDIIHHSLDPRLRL